MTLVLQKNANFFAENCQKSQKFVIITSTPSSLVRFSNTKIFNSTLKNEWLLRRAKFHFRIKHFTYVDIYSGKLKLPNINKDALAACSSGIVSACGVMSRKIESLQCRYRVVVLRF
jgi:ABC-type transport system involved in Fe-S cluster assembly fused permease/ATPase subunit